MNTPTITIDKITVARYIVSRDAPYLTSALFRAPLIPTRLVPVAAMDEHGRIYYNPDELESWQPDQVATVLLHELCHWLNAHFMRAGTRDLRRWNIATDMEIANIIRELGFRLDTPKPHITPEQYNFPLDLLAEEYYDMLSDNENSRSNAAQSCSSSSDISSSSCCSSNNDQSNGISQGNRSGNNSKNDTSTPSHPSGSASDGIPRPWELPADDSEHPGLSEIEQELLRREVAYKMEQHYKQRGAVPAAFQRLIDALHREHQVNWRTILYRVVQSVLSNTGFGERYTYRRPNRRRNGTPFIFPSIRRMRPEVAVIIDTSGSMRNDELNAALAEVDALLHTIRSQVTVLSVDAAVNTVQKIRHTRAIELVGGGGTDMMVGIHAAAALKPKPNIIIVITDGYTPWSSAPPENTPPVVAVLTDAGSEQPPAWVHTVRVRLDP